MGNAPLDEPVDEGRTALVMDPMIPRLDDDPDALALWLPDDDESVICDDAPEVVELD